MTLRRKQVTVWARKAGPGAKMLVGQKEAPWTRGREGERGPRLEGAAIWTDHLFPWPGLASSYVAISEQRKAETGQHTLRTISLLPTGFECNGVAIFTASQLNPFLRNSSLVESAPVPVVTAHTFWALITCQGWCWVLYILFHHCQPPQEAGMMTLFHY